MRQIDVSGPTPRYTARTDQKRKWKPKKTSLEMQNQAKAIQTYSTCSTKDICYFFLRKEPKAYLISEREVDFHCRFMCNLLHTPHEAKLQYSLPFLSFFFASCPAGKVVWDANKAVLVVCPSGSSKKNPRRFSLIQGHSEL